ncbi:MAG: hypothetical protein IAF02_23585 [Anaerolineae bacterium]|nr:hypothetical protein [Anaerolineae bacterium]
MMQKLYNNYSFFKRVGFDKDNGRFPTKTQWKTLNVGAGTAVTLII